MWEIRLYDGQVLAEFDANADPEEILQALKEDFDSGVASLYWVAGER